MSNEPNLDDLGLWAAPVLIAIGGMFIMGLCLYLFLNA